MWQPQPGAWACWEHSAMASTATAQPPSCCRVVSQCTAGLPDGKPRYVMGIGYPLDIVICSGGPAEVWQLAEAAAVAAAAPWSVAAGNGATSPLHRALCIHACARMPPAHTFCG